jgi:hypothetical protein
LSLGDCASDDLTLSKLSAALGSPSKTPRFAFLAPGACEDASQQSCADGSPAVLAGKDAFLKAWVPMIIHSAGFKKDGALIIVFAHAAPSAGAAAPDTGPVRTGALVLSRYSHRGRIVTKTYNPYSILRASEDLLGLQPLAHAKSAKPFVSSALTGA